MKKIISLLLFTLLIFCLNSVSAKIRRVGYFGSPISGTDYGDLQSAHDAASPKDTILLFPGNYSAQFHKTLIVLGYGYFINGTGSNPNLQNIKGTLAVAIYLYSGSDSTDCEGIDGLTIYPVYQQIVNKVIIRRCNVNAVYFNDQVIDGWQIQQCNINAFSYQYSGGAVTNIKVNNCYIYNPYFYANGSTNSSNGQFNNDIMLYGNFNYGSFIIKNCIFLSYHQYDNNCVYQNSIGTSDGYPIPTANGDQNITNASMTNNVFVGYSTQGSFSNDGRWVLKVGSPAKGTGSGGTDVGIFGGPIPHVLSGIPRIPSFYFLNAPSTSTSTNPYTITFSVRSNN